ncbi:hypothetical protein GAY33_05235 [Azospirillum brasilense]|uniref:hypothetical protein n=1 Tax=Azospirillum argentinense TaxID=2970906 RepID=UPI00190BA7E3|nr:hypothetical protein [Azospirillum argentinense]MBK3798640.1 hypothetical protein [Azospirillum argentinense]
MMSHVRQKIREAVAEALTGIVPNVFVNRVRSLPSSKLPAIAVFALEEDVEEATMARTQTRSLLLAVDVIIAAGDEDPSATLDGHCARVETAMAATRNLGVRVKSVALVRTDIEMSGAGEQAQGLPDLAAARLQYRIVYRTPHGQPETAA